VAKYNGLTLLPHADVGYEGKQCHQYYLGSESGIYIAVKEKINENGKNAGMKAGESSGD
jgi:hypothetical protein